MRARPRAGVAEAWQLECKLKKVLAKRSEIIVKFHQVKKVQRKLRRERREARRGVLCDQMAETKRLIRSGDQTYDLLPPQGHSRKVRSIDTPPSHSFGALRSRDAGIVSIRRYITMQPSSLLSSLCVMSSAPRTTPPRSLARSAALPPSNCTTKTPELSGSSAAARLCLGTTGSSSKQNTVEISGHLLEHELFDGWFQLRVVVRRMDAFAYEPMSGVVAIFEEHLDTDQR